MTFLLDSRKEITFCGSTASLNDMIEKRMEGAEADGIILIGKSKKALLHGNGSILCEGDDQNRGGICPLLEKVENTID